MDTSILRVRKSSLQGEIRLQGAKNSALHLLTASLLTAERVVLTNYPKDLYDAQVHVGMLEALGKTCRSDDNTIEIYETAAPTTRLVWPGRSIRNTLLILGSLFARVGYGAVPHPGGCDLGDRKYDIHVQVIEAFGGRVFELGGDLCAERSGPLNACTLELPIRSTGATENALLIASLAEGTSNIYNPHIRPEILNLIEMLELMGASITIHGQERIEVTGNPDGHSGARVNVIPDNMEALTWVAAAAMTGGQVLIHDFPYDHLEVPLIYMRESGVRVFREQRDAFVTASKCYPVEISTGPYPGINSDMQPIFAAFASQANGLSKIVDLRFPGRYQYAAEMQKLGVEAGIEGDFLHVRGSRPLRGCNVTATDLRAGISLVLLGLVADGETRIHESWQIFRGYENFLAKIRSLQGNVDAG
ncbi:UDP-N-acetylglucosamine 1-carboxyvinyltransferase [Sphingosinicella xenopeptidilytica]|uniref:UDP-N-acetylglucosamine 1-carboxyvinyltransferase n=1 Tax=Sphingosinicella xenopeptidilytica TaxID=364098 RepID=A0ABW3C2G7_SPHXN